MILFIALGFCTLSWASDPKPPVEVKLVEMPVYEVPYEEEKVVLHFSYAKAEFHNPDMFSNVVPSHVRTIELVFTRYPYRFEDWLTNYESLLSNRLKALYALDSSLFSRTDITWRYILQTDCKTEPEAMALFHGFVLHVRPDEEVAKVAEEPVEEEPEGLEILLPAPTEKIVELSEVHPEVKRWSNTIYGHPIVPLDDSTIYHVMARNPQWRDMLVVMDWTSSMYEKGSSVLRWYQDHLNQDPIKHLVVFNDGNNKHYKLKKIGRTGGIYHTRPKNMEHVMQTLLKVKKAGIGGDSPENDMEAVLKSTKNLNSYQDLVLIADRGSSVRDLKLVKMVKEPVHVVLFKPDKESRVNFNMSKLEGEEEWVNSSYLTIASYTKGSLHLIDRDITHLHTLETGAEFQIGAYVYQKLESGAWKFVRRAPAVK